ncbi:MAG TPA: type II and III secretion system protein family protein, partial [Thermodesulfobacteriota bacterium]|nr:type II and III secretion system protein family protein [Thermodesulfobacteriota bacterium]
MRRYAIASGICFSIAALLAFAGLVWAGPAPVVLENSTPQRVEMSVGKSTLVNTPEPVKRVSLADPTIADATVLTPQQIYINAKASGMTNVTLWGVNDEVSAILDLQVAPDLSGLREVMHRLFPNEKDIRVTAANNFITLSGNVSSPSSLAQVVALAEPYAPKGEDRKPRVLNLLNVSGVHQVMLEVRVAEMQRSLLRRMGVNWNYISNSGANFGISLLNNLTRVTQAGFPGNPLGVSDRLNAIFRFTGQNATWTVFIDALKEEGLLKVLAEPTLITLSGKSANFLAGGEIPIPVPQPSGVGTTITIQYKPFGVGLNFSPIIMSDNRINMQVAPEVSDLDFSNAVQISGFVVPAFTTRRASTTIELADGQSFAIAGL